MEQLLQLDFLSSIRDFIGNLEPGNITASIQDFADSTFGYIPMVTLNDTFESIDETISAISKGAAVISLILALLGCFFGYRMIKFWISLAGLLIGGIAGFVIAGQFTDNMAYAATAAIIAAILVSFLSYKIYLAGVFLLAGFGAYFLSASYLPLDGTPLIVASVAIGIVVAILAVTYMRPAIIVLTGIQNGLVASGSLITLVPSLHSSNSIPLGVGLAVVGIAFQFMTTRTKKEKRKRQEA
ncbi:MAG: hypothetical protein Q4B70_08785 [Lachnospiraceae bacterium]|nr:hypothetical protein [Lachnospiraceae bacterium]